MAAVFEAVNARAVVPLDAELQRQVNGLRSDLRSRVDHPSYGITKAALRERLARVEGMLLARAAVLGEVAASDLHTIRQQAAQAGAHASTDDGCHRLDVGLVLLRSLIERS